MHSFVRCMVASRCCVKTHHHEHRLGNSCWKEMSLFQGWLFLCSQTTEVEIRASFDTLPYALQLYSWLYCCRCHGMASWLIGASSFHRILSKLCPFWEVYAIVLLCMHGGILQPCMVFWQCVGVGVVFMGKWVWFVGWLMVCSFP
jgi:hypothetical protein